MNETETLALGEALARTADVLRPAERVPFRDYVRRVLDAGEGQIHHDQRLRSQFVISKRPPPPSPGET